MSARIVATLMALLVLVSPAAAQETRGSIEGIIKDSSGAILPGVTVEARGVSVGSTATAVTDGAGVYRFPALPPGRYTVTAALQGFTTAKSEQVDLNLGQVLKIDLAMQLSGVAESVQVTAESPLIDVKQSAAGQNIRRRLHRSAAEGPRLHDGRDAGAGRQQREPQRRHLDRRRLGVGEPLLHRRHRHHQPPHRPLGQGPAQRLRRADPGQVERLRRPSSAVRPAASSTSSPRAAPTASTVTSAPTSTTTR